jgi:hypothetical protein
MRKEDFIPDIWMQAKREAREAIISRAKVSKTMTYEELAKEVGSIDFDFSDISNRVVVSHLLDNVSREAALKGEGIISALVIRKGNQNHMPGDGFFKLLESLGINTRDKVTCWAVAMNEVFRIWGKPEIFEDEEEVIKETESVEA